MYESAFNREPDTEGRNYWVARLNSGELSPAGVASLFSGSAEMRNSLGGSQADFSVYAYNLRSGQETQFSLQEDAFCLSPAPVPPNLFE